MAGKITTGLGPNVDAFVSKSPALAQMLAKAKVRWPQDFKIKAGKDTGRSFHAITVDSKETSLEQALTLVHELGHLLNNRPLIPGGKSFEEFINRNTNAQISEEEAAVRADIQVRNELRKRGIEVPHLVVDAVDVHGNKVLYDLEVLIKNPDLFKGLFPNVITEMTFGNPMRVYWPIHYRHQKDIYKGYKPQVPKINLKRQGSSSLINIQDFLTPKVAGGGVVSGLSQFRAWQQQNQINQRLLVQQQQAQQRIHEAQRHTQEMWEAQRRAQEQQREALRRMQEEAQHRAQEQQREARRRAQEEAQRRAQEQIWEMQRKQQAIQAARIKRPAIDILRPTYWGPGPRYTGTIISGPPLNPSRTLSGGPIGPEIWRPKRP